MAHFSRTIDQGIEAIGALAADGPHGDHADKLELFGRFVGSWDIEATLFSPDGSRSELRGEWHFAWVLDGRAIQDVLISPPRHEQRETGAPALDYGTTVRIYDPRIDAWHVTWITPVGGEVHRLVGWAVGEEIELLGRNPAGELQKWMFSEIAPDGFRWRAYLSHDDGESWFLDQEMRAKRRPRGDDAAG